MSFDKIFDLTAGLYFNFIIDNSPFFSVELLKGQSVSPITKTQNQHRRTPYCTLILRSNACEITRCRSCLDELSTTYSETSTKRVAAVICACTGPIGTGLGVVYVECGGQTWPKRMLTYTNIATRTEKVNQGAPFRTPIWRYLMRTPSLFYLGQQVPPDPNPNPNPNSNAME